MSVKRRGKNIRQPEAYLDLGQSEVFTERSQTRWRCEGATAEKTEGCRHNTAGMQSSVACGAKRNEAVLWDTVARTNEGSDRVKMRNEQRKNIVVLPFRRTAVFFCAVKCLWNGGKPNY
ncbi:MAG: hypothetical protein GZ091_10065 [Paludibacter sp.]|nr:hypothetical protein [Paludibacter sp.]